MVGGPLKLLGVVPVASKHFVATVNADAGPGQCIGHDLQAGVTAGTLHLPEGNVHRTVGLADAAGVALARGLSVDADLELLPLGDHETVGTDVKLDFNDAPGTTATTEGVGRARVLKLPVFGRDLRIARFEGERHVGGRPFGTAELDVGRKTSRVGGAAAVDVEVADHFGTAEFQPVNGACLLYTSPSPRDH